MKSPLRLLVVEDSDSDALLLVRELRREGCEPDFRQVQTRAEMESALSEEEWDLVTADYHMPFFSAGEALELLQERGLDIPFIVVSGKVGEEAAVEIMRAGAHDFVPKDNLSRLVPAIERELREVEDRRERRAAEGELLRSENRYRAVLEQASEAIFLVDPQSMLVLESNPAFQNLLGYSARELQSLTLYDIVAHDRESVDENTRRIMSQGRHRVGERRYRRGDGTLADVEVNVSSVFFGDREVMCIVAHDITARKQTEEKLRQSLNALLAIYEAGQILGSTLETEEVGTRLLQLMRRISSLVTAVISTPEDGELRVWRAIGFENLWQRARYTPQVQEVLWDVMQRGEHRVLELEPPEDSDFESLVGLFLPLRIRAHIIGVLEVYGPQEMAEKEMLDILLSLTSKAASALENARLYGELDRRKRQLQGLVERMIVTQEEERRHVAYEVHDGPAQVAVAAYQHIQAFARRYTPASAEEKELLDNALEFARRTVGESRQIISDLRPTVLDDFGLAVAIRFQVEVLVKEGWRVGYRENLGETRLHDTLETTLYRVAQEAITNLRKHANTTTARLTLTRFAGMVRLRVRDYGAGMPQAPVPEGGPGERVGLTGMRERVGLVGGKLTIYSKAGRGTLVVAEVPVSPGQREYGEELGALIEP